MKMNTSGFVWIWTEKWILLLVNWIMSFILSRFENLIQLETVIIGLDFEKISYHVFYEFHASNAWSSIIQLENQASPSTSDIYTVFFNSKTMKLWLHSNAWRESFWIESFLNYLTPSCKPHTLLVGTSAERANKLEQFVTLNLPSTSRW